MTARVGRMVASGLVSLAYVGLVQAAETKPGCDPAKLVKGSKAEQACNPEAARADVPAVITNEYLERLFGPAEPSKAQPVTASQGDTDAPSDPLKAMEEEKQKAKEQQALAGDRDKQIADAQARVKELERQVLEFKNPLLARPQLSKEETAAQKGMDQAEKVARTQQQLEAARKELEKLQSGSRSGT